MHWSIFLCLNNGSLLDLLIEAQKNVEIDFKYPGAEKNLKKEEVFNDKDNDG